MTKLNGIARRLRSYRLANEHTDIGASATSGPDADAGSRRPAPGPCMVRQAMFAGLMCGASAFGLAPAAQAQVATAGEQQAAPGAEAAASEEGNDSQIVVTGSRLASSFEAPTPVTVVDMETLAATAPNNMGEALAQLPSLAGSIQNSTSGIGSGVSQTNGQNLLNLRRLGADRTLILLDGQRMGVTNVTGSVDINIIPQSLVRRVDVVTGGASASYGSDAVAGVVNFILDTRFEGFKVDVNGGITSRGDVENGRATVAFGRSLGDRGRIIGAAEFFKMNGIRYGEVTGRDWFDNPTTSVANAAGQQPRWLLIPNVRSRTGSFGGTITAVQGCSTAACSALVNQQFLPGGALTPFITGTNAFGNNQYVTGGSGVAVNQPFTPNAERKGGFLHGEYDVTDDITLWAQGSYNSSETFLQAQVLQVQTNNQFRIFEDNAFLPAAVRDVLLADPGLDSFSLTRYNRDMGFNEVTGNVRVVRASAGIKGNLSDTWSFDVIFGHQDTHQDLDIRTAISRNLYAASEAVRHPVTGAIVCRSQWYSGNTFVPAGTGLDPGCVPLNPFGDGAVSKAATDYVMGLNTADIDLKQSTFDLNVRGDFGERISLGAGPISFASGVNYRRLSATRTVDALSSILKDGTGIRSYPTVLQGSIGGYSYYNPSAVDGRVSVTEGYAELGIPLLADVPMFQSLATTLAGRLTDYSQSGLEKTWKIGLNWVVNDSIRFRGTMSSDIRAPSVIELFNTAQVLRGTYTLPSSTAPATFVGSGQNVAVGNPNLTPESARTYVVGVVLSPTFVPGFRAAIDYYRIELLDSIAAPGQQNIIDRCYAGDQFSCTLIKVNGRSITTTAGITANDFVEVTNPLLNEPANEHVSGIDFEAAYNSALGSGDLTLRLTGNYALTSYDPGSGCAAGSRGRTSDFVGAIGACGIEPRIRARLSADYEIGPFGIYVQERYIHKGVLNPNFVSGVDISDNRVPARWYTDVNLTYALPQLLGSKGELYFNVTNLFDAQPPPTNSTAGRSWLEPTETELYDALGRRFVFGARFEW